ncbi:hypothetical protein ACWDBW_26860 [Streptomyces sp. NPDC001107]
MRTRTRTLRPATARAVLFGSTALAVTSAAPAPADPGAVLPVTSAGDVVVDGVHQRVFISDPRSGKVVATDYSGTVESLPGVRGLELSADSGTLCAAVEDADAIVAIDTATATKTHPYPTGADTQPEHPALAGGKLWFGYRNGDSANIGSLDLSGTTLSSRSARTPPRSGTTPGRPLPHPLVLHRHDVGRQRELDDLTGRGGTSSSRAETAAVVPR